MDKEDYLRMQLAQLMRSYQEAAKPIIDELVAIQAMKPPSPIFVSSEQLSQDQLTSLERELLRTFPRPVYTDPAKIILDNQENSNAEKR